MMKIAIPRMPKVELITSNIKPVFCDAKSSFEEDFGVGLTTVWETDSMQRIEGWIVGWMVLTFAVEVESISSKAEIKHNHI